jgi:hypothetical protein
MATKCNIPGNPQMYGLGIRIAFYVQWFGLILVQYMDERDLPDVRILGLILSSATFLGLIIEVSENSLQAAEIYIVLLLCMGYFLFMVPYYLWKALTCCNPYWDPLRWTRERQSRIFQAMNFTLLLAISSFATWFWIAFINDTRDEGTPAGCRQSAFFFSEVSLTNSAYIAFNALLYFLILLVCIGIMLIKSGWEVTLWPKKKKKRRTSKLHAVALQELVAFSNLSVAAVVTAAVELVISWNDIRGVSDVRTAAQIIPIMASGGIVARVIFLHFAKAEARNDDDSSSSESVSHSHRSSRRSSHRSSRRSSGPPPRGPPRGGFPPPPPPAAQR